MGFFMVHRIYPEDICAPVLTLTGILKKVKKLPDSGSSEPKEISPGPLKDLSGAPLNFINKYGALFDYNGRRVDRKYPERLLILENRYA